MFLYSHTVRLLTRVHVCHSGRKLSFADICGRVQSLFQHSSYAHEASLWVRHLPMALLFQSLISLLPKAASLNNWDCDEPSPLPSPWPITPHWPSSDLVTDGADMICQSFSEPKAKLMGLLQISHAAGIVICYTFRLFYLLPSHLIKISLFSHLLLCSNNPLFVFHPLSNGEFLRYWSLLFLYQWFIRWLPVQLYIFFLCLCCFSVKPC